MIPVSYNLRSLTVRRTTTLASVIGIALVVFVLASALMLSEGIHRTMGKSGNPDNAIAMRKGSDNEISSVVDTETVGLILAQPGIAQKNGQPDGLAEVVIVAALDKLGSNGVSNVTLRGMKIDQALAFRPEARIIEGRMPNPGTDEVVVGKAVAGRFKGLSVGQSFEVRRNRPFHVVGVFEAGGSSYESEVWGDIDAVRTAFGREGMVSSVRVRLASPSSFDAFQAAVEHDKRLGLAAMRETDFNEKQSEMTATVMTVTGALISFFFALGAALGATITMYTSISSRSREVGTLRALGFGRLTIMGSFLLEALLIAVGGGLVGVLAATLMGFVRFSTMNFGTWSEIVFTFTPTAGILTKAMLVAGVTGLLGGLYPAWKASKMSPVAAMKR